VAADSLLFVGTREGNIHCFGADNTQPTIHQQENLELAATPLAERAKYLIDQTNVKDGYCVVLGVGSGQLIDELLRQSELRLIVIDPDAARVQKIRERFADSDLYGTRITVCNSSITMYSLPP
jgi:hypothetical protein